MGNIAFCQPPQKLPDMWKGCDTLDTISAKFFKGGQLLWLLVGFAGQKTPPEKEKILFFQSRTLLTRQAKTFWLSFLPYKCIQSSSSFFKWYVSSHSTKLSCGKFSAFMNFFPKGNTGLTGFTSSLVKVTSCWEFSGLAWKLRIIFLCPKFTNSCYL